MATQEEIARQLIALVERASAAEAVLLRRRIEAVMHYMADVTRPNLYTLDHIRAFLSGKRDGDLDQWVGRHTDEQENGS